MPLAAVGICRRAAVPPSAGGDRVDGPPADPKPCGDLSLAEFSLGQQPPHFIDNGLGDHGGT